MGESFIKHELKIGKERLKGYGIELEFLPNSLKGIDFIKNHPKSRAQDLLRAFSDDSIDMILCAIGGDDTYRLLPYLFESNELKNAVGTDMKKHINTGFELLRGKPVFAGKILGGCLDSIYYMFDTSRFEDTVSLCNKYNLFPSLEEWKGKILLLETSEEKPAPDLFRKMINALKEYGIFDVISGVLVGKPQNEIYYDEYRKILLEEISNKDLSIVYNLNIGHSTPRCIIPFGVDAKVNVERQVITFNY